MHVDSIGGPSAGMMYTLGLIDKLTPANESGGKTIAGTGTIDKDGKVGRIGGIELKMLGAKRDGATWFLAPASNCLDVAGPRAGWSARRQGRHAERGVSRCGPSGKGRPTICLIASMTRGADVFW